MNWTIIQIDECFITRETGKAVQIRLPRWLDDVVGTFWLPAGCLKRDKFPPELCIPESMKIEISYKKADDFGVFGDWQKREYTPETIKKFMFEVDGHEPARGDYEFVLEAPELAPVHVEPLEELIDA